MKDYYKILEVNKSASFEIISKVYKLLAKKYHPDMNLENPEEAEEKFKDISEAYEILSDEEKRKTYDKELEEYEEQLRKQEDSSNYVPLETFMKLQEYCVNLEQSIAKLVGSPNNNYSNNIVLHEDNEIVDMPQENLQKKLDELEYQEKRAKRIEFIKNIFAAIITLIFILWFIKQNNGIITIK